MNEYIDPLLTRTHGFFRLPSWLPTVSPLSTPGSLLDTVLRTAVLFLAFLGFDDLATSEEHGKVRGRRPFS